MLFCVPANDLVPFQKEGGASGVSVSFFLQSVLAALITSHRQTLKMSETVQPFVQTQVRQ